MSDRIDRLFDLLPAVYRRRDEASGWPLRALLRTIAEQVNIVEDDIAQLYDNWFIETCEDWVVPYIGDLVDYRPGSDARTNALNPRREVANLIRDRRRKGSLGLLYSLASDITTWPTLIVELRHQLGVTQSLRHLAHPRAKTIDIGDAAAIERLGGPFDRSAHGIEVRRIDSTGRAGRYTVPAVGLFAWRLKPCPVTVSAADCADDIGPHCFTFSILGNDAPLFSAPPESSNLGRQPDELNVPGPISRARLEHHRADYYGEGKSFVLYSGTPRQVVPLDHLVVADLSGWKYRPRQNQIAVDPVLGRIAFAHDQWPKKGLSVSYHYGFSADIGGGEYHRQVLTPAGAVIYRVGEGEHFGQITAALDRWKQEQPAEAIIEITDSATYVEPISIEIEAAQTLQLRAADGCRPVIRLLEWNADTPNFMSVTGQKGSRFALDGLLVNGRALEVNGPMEAVTIRHSTLVPGWGLHHDCEPRRPAEPSLELIDTTARVTIERSIIGSIRLTDNVVKAEPVSIRISDSVLDATGSQLEALSSPDSLAAHADLTVLRSTVLGEISVHSIALAEDSIFTGIVRTARRQIGCVRFCYVPGGSRTPPRYKCQPDGVEQMVPAGEYGLVDSERARVRPQFNSVRYGTAAYCQLAVTVADEIKRGASDESEMGAFHDLFEPQRLSTLRARLDEYLPAGLEASVIFVT